MDWEAWHREYDDPASNLSRRLAFVQAHIRDFLNSTTGPVTITSACAGDGRDILDVLATRDDAGRATVTLLDAGNTGFTVGRHRYGGEPQPLAAGTQLFTFVR